jgi:hypothetical protein
MRWVVNEMGCTHCRILRDISQTRTKFHDTTYGHQQKDSKFVFFFTYCTLKAVIRSPQKIHYTKAQREDLHPPRGRTCGLQLESVMEVYYITIFCDFEVENGGLLYN